MTDKRDKDTERKLAKAKEKIRELQTKLKTAQEKTKLLKNELLISESKKNRVQRRNRTIKKNDN